MSDLLHRVLEALVGRTRQGLRQVQATIVTCGTLGNRRLGLIGMLTATLLMSACAHLQMMGALVEPENQMQAPLQSAKPMTAERTAWLKDRCAQLVAYYDRYGVSRPFQNSDGRFNHTRMGAEVECDRGHYRNGIDAMSALLVLKRFDVPKSAKPAVEPEDQ